MYFEPYMIVLNVSRNFLNVIKPGVFNREHLDFFHSNVLGDHLEIGTGFSGHILPLRTFCEFRGPLNTLSKQASWWRDCHTFPMSLDPYYT